MTRLCYPLDLVVECEGQDSSLHIFGPTISARGMFISTRQALPDGAVFTVSFRLPAANFRVSARSQVRYSLPGVGLGVEFIDLPPAARHAIEFELATVVVNAAKR